MCLSPHVPHDNSAELAAQKEAEREARITQGQTNIDQAFHQFDDPYFSNISKGYSDYYNPQLDKQYTDAVSALTAQLGQQGILQSSAGNKRLADLATANTQQHQAVIDRGLGSANTARQQVADSKSNLYRLNTSSADPSLAASQAVQAAGSVISPPNYSPLANVFGGFLGNAYNAGTISGYLPGGPASPPYNYAGSSGTHGGNVP